MTRKNIAVTGGAGRLGKYVAAEIGKTANVTVLDRLIDRFTEGARRIDVTAIDSLRSAFKDQQVVVHLAGADASANVPAETTFHTNAGGTWNVFEAAAASGVEKVIICSSMAALGISKRHPPLYLPIDEQHPCLLGDTYTLSKQIGEYVAQTFAKTRGLSIVCIRPSYITFPAIVRYIQERVGTDRECGVGVPGQDESYQEGLSATRSYIRPDDLARAFSLAVEFRGEPYEVFNIAACDSFSPEPVLDFCANQFGAVPEIRDSARWRNDPFASLLDISYAARKLGWAPTGQWADVVAEEGQARRH